MSYTMATDGSEEIAPDKIPGTADIMVESHCRTYLGIDIRQRVLGWSQKNHDDYVIYEQVFKNTGIFTTINGLGYPDTSKAEIIRPQTLDSVFIYRSFLAFTKDDLKNSRARWWGSWTPPMDSLRICYVYPARMLPSTAGSTPYDNTGWPLNNFNQPRICAPHYMGEALLFVSKNVNDMTTDDPSQPKIRTVWDMRPLMLKDPIYLHLNETEQKWDAIVHGLNDWNTSSITKAGYIYPPRYPQYSQYPYYEQPPDRGNVAYVENIAGWGDGTTRYMTEPKYSMGPYTLQPGDSIRVVYALVVGTISKRKGFDIGTQWWNYENNPTTSPCAPPPGCDWNNGNPVDNLPPQYKVAGSPIYDNQNDWAKDCWVSTGKDSLFINARAAQWNAKKNFNIPTAPPPPSLTVTKALYSNQVKWGSESESASDFAGYRVYHARGSYADSEWVMVFETRKGTTLVHEFRDSALVVPNENYYYYVTAFNDGSQGPDFDGSQNNVESGMYANMTMLPSASFTKAVNNMDSIRVVPNPFNLAAEKMNYSGVPNKIRFVNIPNECTIRIFTESGDLIKTIYHKGDLSKNPYGEGAQDWSEGEGVSDNGFQLTSSGQRPVSGIYIANFTTPDGRSKNVKFVIIR
jgi:hypothetical protein